MYNLETSTGFGWAGQNLSWRRVWHRPRVTFIIVFFIYFETKQFFKFAFAAIFRLEKLKLKGDLTRMNFENRVRIFLFAQEIICIRTLRFFFANPLSKFLTYSKFIRNPNLCLYLRPHRKSRAVELVELCLSTNTCNLESSPRKWPFTKNVNLVQF